MSLDGLISLGIETGHPRIARQGARRRTLIGEQDHLVLVSAGGTAARTGD